MLVAAIAIGLLYGFILFELCGLVAGGLIAPGYVAVSLDQPWMVALCLIVSLLTLLLVRLLGCALLLYGRRRFIVCVLLGFVLQWLIGAAFMESTFGLGRINVVGYIIPGLLANEMGRQGIVPTLLSLLLLSCLVWLTLYAIRGML